MFSALRRTSIGVAAGAALAITLALPAAGPAAATPPPGLLSDNPGFDKALPMFGAVFPVLRNLVIRVTSSPLLIVQ
ncbi:hypothetical protein [Nonomuraea zeae]|uniref:Uncharacterized protein n=1 Tax=Nonomuraea zeae TaxID=1642303 RepID=A0A5S4GIZ0_9ACTN|nr:hypothetical protein [Nonomuraea zeae]TMR32918.1 hypothetical protein ETD85_21525 [Nonomuraea zeae]